MTKFAFPVAAGSRAKEYLSKASCNFLGMTTKLLGLLAFLTAALLSADQLALSDEPYPFGMCSNEHIFSNTKYGVSLLSAGSKICRVDASFNTARAKNDSEPAKWDWHTFGDIQRTKTGLPQLDWLPILGYEPGWAQNLSYASSAEAYGQYVFEAVNRNKSSIHSWESWNEPDLPGHSFFRGNGKDFFPFQKACYLAAKKADPNCHVLFAGLCFSNVEGYLKTHNLIAPSTNPSTSCFFEEYLEECVKDSDAKKNNYYFDIMSQHSYSRATDLYDYAKVDQALMRKYLYSEKPIWFTETGFVDTGGAWGGNADEYCDYLLQSYAWAKLAGVERVLHFQLDNSNGHGLYKAMLGDPKLALTAYRDVLTKELGNFPIVKQLHGNAGVGFLEGYSPYHARSATGYNLFEFKRAAGPGRILMCFTDSSDAVVIKIPTQSPTATLIDRHNIRTNLIPKSGYYSLTLPGATNNAGWPVLPDLKAKSMGKPEHLVGGATFLIVEK